MDHDEVAPPCHEAARQTIEAEDPEESRTSPPVAGESEAVQEEAVPAAEATKESKSPTKRSSKVTSWFRNRLRSSSEAQPMTKEKATLETPPTDQSEVSPPVEPISEAAEAKNEVEPLTSDSMRDVALAGRITETEDM